MSKLDEPVQLCSHKPEWLDQAQKEIERISSSSAASASSIRHIGSTAVPDLLAKPIIDLMVGADQQPSQRIHASLVALGYQWLGDFPGRSYFRLRGELDFNVHVVLREGEHWKKNLSFVEYLRNTESARIKYAQAKQRAISSGHTQLLSYSAAKEPVLSHLLMARLHRNAG